MYYELTKKYLHPDEDYRTVRISLQKLLDWMTKKEDFIATLDNECEVIIAYFESRGCWKVTSAGPNWDWYYSSLDSKEVDKVEFNFYCADKNKRMTIQEKTMNAVELRIFSEYFELLKDVAKYRM